MNKININVERRTHTLLKKEMKNEETFNDTIKRLLNNKVKTNEQRI